ncbi:hypothetical protein COU57_01415 [Candidatus Pacearchaeota archaeon CG10_big_fil_rev_8_21_14_0_10_32_14]|nr:MAG: hypothetical protein COU57_01415 [Candidatus Pacearchaeota archaeon CG10_big_fil_rev_8_21_14_0_10_32_14]
MNCPHCGNVFVIKLAAKVNCIGCRVLSSMTTIMTIECEKCNQISQLPIQNKTIMNIEKDKG